MREEGVVVAHLKATITGLPFYLRYGWLDTEGVLDVFRGGVAIPCIGMSKKL